MASIASSTSVRTASGVNPAANPSWARRTDSSARRMASVWRALVRMEPSQAPPGQTAPPAPGARPPARFPPWQRPEESSQRADWTVPPGRAGPACSKCKMACLAWLAASMASRSSGSSGRRRHRQTGPNPPPGPPPQSGPPPKASTWSEASRMPAVSTRRRRTEPTSTVSSTVSRWYRGAPSQ